MTTLELPINEHWLSSFRGSEEELRQELREILAAKLFELGRMTLAQSAELADLPLWVFMERLSQLKVSIVNQTRDDLLDELADIRN
jgi:predicted HTH domain antitoxin